MFPKNIIAAFLAVLFLVIAGRAQSSEVTITLNEQFFDAFLDAMFQNGAAPEISLSKDLEGPSDDRVGFVKARTAPVCAETIKFLRENHELRTAVRFRDGRIYMPIAFSGNYNPPLIGCVDFAGYAESNIDLEFDKQGQRLIGRVRVLNVVLNGTAGIGSSVLTKMVQSSIDKRLNPFEIIRADKLSFTLPIQSSSVRMEATGIRSEIVNNSLVVHIDYSFPK